MCWRFACEPARYLQVLSVLLVCFVWWRRGITQGIGQSEKELHIRPPGRYHKRNIGKCANLGCPSVSWMRICFCCELLLFWLCIIFVVSGERLFSLIGEMIEPYPVHMDFAGWAVFTICERGVFSFLWGLFLSVADFLCSDEGFIIL